MNSVTMMIATAQRTSYAADVAQWTHAAVYVGDGMLIEAVANPPACVIESSIADLVPGRVLRRLHYPNLATVERAAIAAAARAMIGEPYSKLRAALVGLDMLGVRMGLAKEPEWQDIFADAIAMQCICTDVVDRAFVRGINDIVTPDVRGVPMPAALAASNRFTAFDVAWCRIA